MLGEGDLHKKAYFGKRKSKDYPSPLPTPMKVSQLHSVKNRWSISLIPD